MNIHSLNTGTLLGMVSRMRSQCFIELIGFHYPLYYLPSSINLSQHLARKCPNNQRSWLLNYEPDFHMQ